MPWLSLERVKRLTSEELALPMPSEEDFDRIYGELNVVGHPKSVAFRKAEDVAFLVLYFSSIGHKHSTKAALAYWAYPKVTRLPPPTARHIEEAVRRLKSRNLVESSSTTDKHGRHWSFSLRSAAEAVRIKYRLAPLPTAHHAKWRIKGGSL
jgi:hypothetical protein